MWKVLQVVALFATAGVLLAKDTLLTLGFNAETPVIIAVGLGITTMLINRSVWSILAMGLFFIMVSLPQETLDMYNLDHDMLLAAAITTLFLPWIQRLNQKSS